MDKLDEVLGKLVTATKTAIKNFYLEGAPFRHFYEDHHIWELNNKLRDSGYKIERNRGEGEGLTIGYWVTKENKWESDNAIARFLLSGRDDVFSTKDSDILHDWLKRNLSKELGWTEPSKTISPEALKKALGQKFLPKPTGIARQRNY